MSTDRNLRLQVILQAIDKVTAPLRGVDRSSKAAAKALRSTLDELKQLKAQQAAIGEFRTLQGAAKASSDQLKAMRARVAELRSAHVTDADAAKAHARELAAAEKAVRRGAEAYDKQMRSLAALKQRLASLGITNVAADERRLAGALAATNARADQQRAKANQLAEAWKRAQQQRKLYDERLATAGKLAAGGAATAAVGVGLGAPVLSSVKAYASLEDAMLGIARQVPGARDDAGRLTAVYQQLKGQVHQLGREIPLTTEQLAEMMGAGARMEVPTEALADYTRSAAMMALAFDAVPAEIAEAMGKVGKNFKIPVQQITGLADAINYLDDNSIAKGAEIIDVLNRISGVVSTVKMSAADAAALSSTLLTLGERPETASTAINALTQKLAAATKGTKKFQAAVDEIGLDTRAIQQGMQKDATGTLMGVLEAIRKLPESKRIGVMVELAGMEHSDTLAKLVDKPEELQRQRALANGPEARGSMLREFQARADNLSAKLQTSRNRAAELSATLGETLKPTLDAIKGATDGLLDRLNTWARDNPRLASGLMHVLAAVAGVLLAVGTLTLGLTAVLGPLAVVRYGLAMLGMQGGLATAAFGLLRTAGAAAFGGLAKGILLVGRALLLNPIGLGITAIATAAYLIYEYWEPIKAFFARLWESVKKIFWVAIDALLAPLRLLREGLNAIGFKIPEIPRFSEPGAVKVDDRPPLPAGAGSPRPVMVAGGPTQVTVNAAPGMNERDLAREVARQMDKRDAALAARGRSSLQDRD
ncbi:MAG: phage tail tape measure protein [Pseudomonadota bacterium]